MRRRSALALVVALAMGATALVGSSRPAQAGIPGGNGKLAFTAGTPPVSNVYVMNPDGSNRAALTEQASGVAGSPAWAPDGSRVAFAFRIIGMGQPTFINAVAADGSGWTVLQDDLWINGHPSWSPDGSRFVYSASNFAASPHLWVANADGSGAVKITAGSSHNFSPAWSPDGSSIAFVSDRNGALKIYTISPDGTGIQRITGGTYADVDPAWSPDGGRLAITSDRDGDFDVYVISVGGAVKAQLTNAPGYDGEPAWSPDGARLAFVSNRTGNDDIWVMRHDGTQQRNITATPGTPERGPDWQPAPPRATPTGARHGVGLHDPATGVWHLRSPGGDTNRFYFGNPGDDPIMGDWDCDGVETPGLYRPADGYVYLRNSNDAGAADLSFFFGNPGDMPLAGDFDGDGCDTVSVYRPSTGQVFVINELGSADQGLGAADFSYYFGNPGDKPFVGDFTGDGAETVGLHRESTGLVYFRETHTQGAADHEFIYGDPGDRLVAGDWIADGIDTVGIYRPADQAFHQRFSNTQGVADAQFGFGEPDWRPVAGDFAAAPPAPVTGVSAHPSAGSGEIDVSWTRSIPKVDHYRVYYSYLPGAAKSLIAAVDDVQLPWLPPGRRGLIDWPRLLTIGRNCYQVTALNAVGNESPPGTEVCLSP